jgi:hypothetical protein
VDATQLKELGTKYIAAWCSRNAASVAAFFAEDGSLKINGGALAVCRTAITAAAQGFMTAFPDMAVTMDSVSGYEEWTFGADRVIAESKGHFDEAEYNRQPGK